MNDKHNTADEELDCLVTVDDGAYMTCDMIEAESPQKEEAPQDHNG